MRHIIKQGRVHRIFSQPPTDGFEPPEGEFPVTVMADNEAHLVAQIGTSDYKIYDVYAEADKKKAAQSSEPRLPKAVVKSQLEALGLPPERIKAVMDRQVSVIQAEPQQAALGSVMVGHELQESALVEFRVLMAKYAANPKDERAKTEVEAVANFILRLWPDLEAELAKAKPGQEKRFSL